MSNKLADPDLVPELNDNVYNFIEDEVGRYDYINNWENLLNRGKAKSVADAWLKRQDLHYVTDDFVRHVTDVINSHQGAPWSWDY